MRSLSPDNCRYVALYVTTEIGQVLCLSAKSIPKFVQRQTHSCVAICQVLSVFQDHRLQLQVWLMNSEVQRDSSCSNISFCTLLRLNKKRGQAYPIQEVDGRGNYAFQMCRSASSTQDEKIRILTDKACSVQYLAASTP